MQCMHRFTKIINMDSLKLKGQWKIEFDLLLATNVEYVAPLHDTSAYITPVQLHIHL